MNTQDPRTAAAPACWSESNRMQLSQSLREMALQARADSTNSPEVDSVDIMSGDAQDTSYGEQSTTFQYSVQQTVVIEVQSGEVI